MQFTRGSDDERGMVSSSRGRHQGAASHNMAITSWREEDGTYQYATVGGRFLWHPVAGGPFSSPGVERGVWMSVGHVWPWGTGASEVPPGSDKAISPLALPEHWRDLHLIFDGTHAGCINERSLLALFPADASSPGWYGRPCSFAGRLSLVRHRRTWLLYSVAHLRDAGGSDFIQVTRSEDGRSWLPFQLLHIQGFAPSTGTTSMFAAQENPVHNGSLVALLPMVHRSRACIGITFSLDGLAWSAFMPLVRCMAFGSRAAHNPVAGGLHLIGRGRVACFIHEDIPGVSTGEWEPYPAPPDESTPLILARETFGQRLPAVGHRAHVASERVSRVVRITFPCGRLAFWTQRALQALLGGPDAQGTYACAPDARCERA